MNAGWAHPSRVEGVPLVSAVAKPFVFFARRPAAEWAADARRFGLAGFILFKLATKTTDFLVSVTTEPFLTRLIGFLRVAFA